MVAALPVSLSDVHSPLDREQSSGNWLPVLQDPLVQEVDDLCISLPSHRGARVQARGERLTCCAMQRWATSLSSVESTCWLRAFVRVAR